MCFLFQANYSVPRNKNNKNSILGHHRKKFLAYSMIFLFQELRAEEKGRPLENNILIFSLYFLDVRTTRLGKDILILTSVRYFLNIRTSSSKMGYF